MIMTDDKNLKSKGDDDKGADLDKNEKSKSKPFDSSTIGDDDFEKIFDDPRLFKHKRFKELNEAAQKAKELEKSEAERQEKELEKNKKFQELADKYKTERDEANKKVQQSLIDNQITLHASKSGIVDIDAALKLIDRTNIKIDDNGTVTGVEDSVKSLLESKSYLKGNQNNITIGNATNPSGTSAVKKFTLSQIQDPKFYQENQKDILEAYKTPGAIIDDTQQTPA